MKVLSISTDRKLFENGSPVQVRNIEYASKMKELHVVVFSLKKLGLKPQKIGNLFIYPTSSLSRWLYVFGAYYLAKKIVAENGFLPGESVISTQDPFETGLVGFYLKKKFKLPLQLQSHTDFFSPLFGKTLLNKIRLFIVKKIISTADGFRVVNQSVGLSITKHFPNLSIKPETLPVFVDTQKIMDAVPKRDIKKDFPQFKFIIFMASRITPEKNLDTAIHVLNKIVEQFSYVGLVIAGEGEEKVNLENLARKLGVADKVVFIGWQDDLVSYYKTADVFLLTSEYEGYGMTLIEAGASGSAIVTTKVGVADTDLFVNGKNSYVCPPWDTECLFHSVLGLIMDDKKRELFKQEMQDSIRKISITKEEYIAKYVSLLQNLSEK
ncbi:MAG: hypothetical protein A2566_02150 [Candidatus Zambryskibacteria bacterium RIFOXYD1_FULL_40_13]|nr:MAG: Glycosyltransferase [Parcubacteria group bacterium GW2011_GWC1_39_12]KKR35581.1 MAG: Glycosyltransferase [Parcubacteria group bacterium GW2011_GWC2_40_10]KKR51992.1 MAG: Glycosyltransferase [Parcubacteria group bacterium GW2011_GWE1_40_20]KKR66341.1 MAG: Glycosyltransferase [Parcubacteria group bacterium GW2011_GWB1_40_5]KKR80383.1 MAG: Glycosyltransferase [Parcubacteria group bacterium GW2011_GWD1_40_9]KKS35904.1 MAG: Glycosyltransferase [Parcubacteria group bacterium GW2011_GWE2_42_1